MQCKVNSENYKLLQEYPSSDSWELVERTCLSKFLPRLPQEALFKAMKLCGIEKATSESGESQLSCSVEDGVLKLGQTKTKIYEQGNMTKVPDVVFYDTNQVFYSIIF